MAAPKLLLPRLVLVLSLLNLGWAASRRLAATTQTSDQTQKALSFRYHNGQLLTGKLSINLVWYGHFNPSQRAIISDFVTSVSPSAQTTTTQPSVATWWRGTDRYYRHVAAKSSPSFVLGAQVSDDDYSLGRSLTEEQLVELATRGGGRRGDGSISVVLTSSDVAVEGFCSSRCGTHRSVASSRLAYIWVGNSETQCPGFCAWPFHQPIYGPQGPPLVSPNNDVGLDGMVINLAGLLAGTVTNPYGNGYFQGPKEAPLEAASACPGIYGKGAYPGYPGDLLVDPTSGASYNANGVNGRKYLVPALYDPSTSTCSPLV